MAGEPPLTGKAWADEWERQHRDPRAEMLCSAHEGTLLVEARANRALWIPALSELLRLGLIEFHAESRDRVVTPLSSKDALAALEDPEEWEPHEGPQVGFGTTGKGERAVDAKAFHYIGGQFTEYDESKP